MKRITYLVLALVMLTSFAVMASEQIKEGQKWVDITKKFLANPADQGGWTEDAKGKIFRSEDSNVLKAIHSTFGTFIINLTDQKVYKVEGGKNVLQEGSILLQRDFGTSLVVKTKTVKLRLKFTDKVSGMANIPGIKAK